MTKKVLLDYTAVIITVCLSNVLVEVVKDQHKHPVLWLI